MWLPVSCFSCSRYTTEQNSESLVIKGILKNFYCEYHYNLFPVGVTFVIQGAPEEGESRNVLVESARIARGPVKPITELSSASADAVFLPGGFGAAKNL